MQKHGVPKHYYIVCTNERAVRGCLDMEHFERMSGNYVIGWVFEAFRASERYIAFNIDVLTGKSYSSCSKGLMERLC